MTKRRTFSKEFKQQVVKAALNGQKRKVSQWKKQHHLSDPMVSYWIKKHKTEQNRSEFFQIPRYKKASPSVRTRNLFVHLMNRLRFYEVRFKELREVAYSSSCELDASLIESYLDLT